ncbi:MAG: DNA polymerase III subunit delta [Alphaproteobacteria bacterium]
MTAIRANDISGFVAGAARGTRLILVYGPDQGSVAENVQALLATITAARAEPPNTVSLTSDDLATDPGRLADEAGTVSMFGGDPLIRLRVTDGRHNILPAVKALIEAPPAGVHIIVEAGDLKKSSGLRKAFEASRNAAALPCYAPSSQDIASMITALAADAGKTVSGGAMTALTASLGADRLVTRGEIEKLLLYVGDDAPGITEDDVRAIIGESAELRNDRVIDNALCGRPGDVEADLARLRLEQASSAALLAQVLRQLIDLQAMRAGFEAGASPQSLMAKQRPPVFFKRQNQVEQAIRAWPAADLARARSLVAEAVLTSRRQPALDQSVASDALMKIAAKGLRLVRNTDRP